MATVTLNWGSQALDALALSYQRWCDDHGLPQVSMDEQDHTALSSDENLILMYYMHLWEALSRE